MSSAHNETFSPANLKVLGGLLLLAIILGEVVFNSRGGSGAMVDPMGSMEDIALRLKPVVTLDDIRGGKSTASAAADTGMASSSAAADTANMTPEQLYQGACFACHGTGAAGAPKLGDAAAWSARIGKGMDELVASAIKGIGTMPPKGGSQYSDDQLRAAVEYLVEGSK